VFTSSSFKKFSFSIISLFIYLLLFFSLLNLYTCSSTVRTIEKKTKELPKRGYKIITGETNQIRVLLSEETKLLSLKVRGAYKLISDNEENGKLKNGDDVVFQLNNGGAKVKINAREIDGITFLLQPMDSESVVLFSGKKYSGDFIVVCSDNLKLLAINRLSVEDYLLGVLQPEMAVKANQTERFEALKAFAVCARTFAEMKKIKSNTYYDITDDVRDQVFSGCGVNTELDKKAVQETTSEVLRYKEKLAEIFYHSACGGMLEDPVNVFSGKGDDYLVAKKDGNEFPNCQIAPNFNWKESYSHADIISLLRAKNLLAKSQQAIKNIEISDTFPSGRVKELRVRFEKGNDIIVKAADIRSVFTRKESKGILRSTLFTLSTEMAKDRVSKITLTGKGSGHGVGLCQWGAMNLSAKGKKYTEILEFYFQGCVIGKTE